MVLVAGSANVDFVVRAAHIPAPGETVLGSQFQTFPGGKGANQAVACARAGGAPTAMLLALGRDAFAATLTDSLGRAGVHMHTVHSAAQPTGTAFICVSDDGENAITVAPGANLDLLPEHLAQHMPSLQGVSHLLMQLETPLPTVLAYAQAARSNGIQVVLNVAPAQALAPALLNLVDILVVNEGELAVLTSAHSTLEDQLMQLQAPCVVVTLGSAGCLARVRDAQGNSTLHKQAAWPVAVVDTTAAGDTFCGALVAALAGEWAGAPQGSALSSLPQALRQASAAAALTCTQLGAQSSIPTHQAVLDLMQQ